MRKTAQRTPGFLLTAGACLGVLANSGSSASAQVTNTDDKITSLEQQNSDLQSRLTTLENLAKQNGLLPSGTPSKSVSALEGVTLSGFVQASYFYDTRHPVSGNIDQYLWNTRNDSFSLNKVKLTLASKPVDPDKWDAAFQTSLMFGQDAPYLNTGDSVYKGTGFNDLREAYVELNVPVGTGIDIKAGELISLLNWESGDGGAANPNFSQGLQWWFTGNGPSAGIQGTYNFTSKVGLTLRVDNGLYQGPVAAHSGKNFSGTLNFKPTKDLWFNLIGWYDNSRSGANNTISGTSIIGGYQVTSKIGTGWEADYFHYSSGIVDDWSVGGWAWYDFTDKVGLALRADYVSQDTGDLLNDPLNFDGLNNTSNGGGIGSLTLTLNYKPVPSLKIQPEVRYDYTTYDGGLQSGGQKSRILLGLGATYSF